MGQAKNRKAEIEQLKKLGHKQPTPKPEKPLFFEVAVDTVWAMKHLGIKNPNANHIIFI